MFAKVIVDIAHSNVDRLFTYEIPEGLNVQSGQRVLAPFGSKDRPVEGFVLQLSQEAEEGYSVKCLIRTLEPYTVLTKEQIQLAYWMKNTYRCLLVDALRLMIPAQLRGGRVKEKLVRTVRLAEGAEPAALLSSLLCKNGTSRAPVQSEVIELLASVGAPMSTADVTGFIPGAAGAIRALLDKGMLTEQGFVTYRSPFSKTTQPTQPLTLNAAQSVAYSAIINAAPGQTFLLHGVTGSGKTEVYMQAIGRAIANGGTAIVLVPEIALTPQAMERFRGRFGERVAVLHSHLSAGERFDEWRRIRLGKVDVVVGARSAVFAPLEKIKLIVIDEEHESSYRSELTPRYSALDVAKRRCSQYGAALVLGSATPSVVSYHRAERGKYTLLSLPQRVNLAALPTVYVEDMREEFLNGNSSIFSARLYGLLKACLEAGEQAILFINRRGYSTFVSCRGCGYVFKCPHCDVSLTYHKLENAAKCHYCGYSQRLPEVCPECGKPYIKYFGIGTQQVEEQLKKHFPGATALRMDTDTTRGKTSHHDILAEFTSGRVQVLIGTQMVAKGLDIPNVTLVGVIAADATLHIPDYRSCERAFQLLTQVAGRAGREEKKGCAVIQTYSPEHPAVVFAAEHDYAAFYNYEIKMRRAAMFPPFSLFLRALFVGTDEAALDAESARFANGLAEKICAALAAAGGDARELMLLSASPAPIRRKQGLYRYQVVIKLARTRHTAAALQAIFDYADSHRTQSLHTLEADPQNMF